MTLEQVLAGNAMNLLRQDHGKAMRFYAMSWALHHYLTTAKHKWRDRFLAWESKCRGSLPGSKSTRTMGSAQAATAAFLLEFGKDLPTMEKAFQAWLAAL